MNKVVSRVEDRNGLGYKGRKTGDSFWITGDYTSLDDCTSCLDWDYTGFGKGNCRVLPWEDGIPKQFLKRNGWYFAFNTVYELTRYFSPYDLFIMSKFGGVVVKYEVHENHIWRGYNQCVFFKERAKVVERLCTSEYTFVKGFGDWVDMEMYEETVEEFLMGTGEDEQ